MKAPDLMYYPDRFDAVINSAIHKAKEINHGQTPVTLSDFLFGRHHGRPPLEASPTFLPGHEFTLRLNINKMSLRQFVVKAGRRAIQTLEHQTPEGQTVELGLAAVCLDRLVIVERHNPGYYAYLDDQREATWVRPNGVAGISHELFDGIKDPAAQAVIAEFQDDRLSKL